MKFLAAANCDIVVPECPAPVPSCETLAFPAAAAAPAALSVADLSAGELQRVEAMARFIRDVDDARRTLRLSGPAAVAAVVARGSCQILSHAGHGGGDLRTYRNYRQWRKRLLGPDGRPNYRAVDALIDRRGRATIEASCDPDFLAAFCKFYLTRNGPGIPASYQLACIDYRKEHPLSPVDAIPSIHTIRRYVARQDQTAIFLRRSGDEAFRNRVGDWIDRDFSVVPVGAMFVGDHRKFDLYIRIWDAEANCWRAVRPWICAWMDARSGYLVGYRILPCQPNGLVVATTLCDAIRKAGNVAPDYVYIDNGKDFLVSGLFSPVVYDGHEHSIALALGIADITALPYNARAKLVERRAFGTFSSCFDRLHPSYLGHCAKFRDKATEDFRGDPSSLLSVEQFTETVDVWVDLFYHRKETRSKVSDHVPAFDLWEGRHPHREPLSEAELAFKFLMPLRPQGDQFKVGRGTRLRLGGRDYANADCRELRDAILTGRRFMVKRDLWNADHVYLFDVDGRPVCEATAKVPVAAVGAPKHLLAEAARSSRRLESLARREARLLTGGDRVRGNDMLELVNPELPPALPPGETPLPVAADFVFAAVAGPAPAAPAQGAAESADIEEFQVAIMEDAALRAGAAPEADDWSAMLAAQ